MFAFPKEPCGFRRATRSLFQIKAACLLPGAMQVPSSAPACSSRVYRIANETAMNNKDMQETASPAWHPTQLMFGSPPPSQLRCATSPAGAGEEIEKAARLGVRLE